mmetsp:Transcript_88930/g.203389  ORF Transcript_88930/g.203389 Transcript_88930/m.203389 type:complete len:431 (-) Transcript_88930:122-1414(-)
MCLVDNSFDATPQPPSTRRWPILVALTGVATLGVVAWAGHGTPALQHIGDPQMKFAAASHDAWQQWDQNGDGVLSAEELTMMLDPLRINRDAAAAIHHYMRAAWTTADADGDEKISEDEVTKVLKKGVAGAESLMRQVFEVLSSMMEHYDKDDSWGLSEGEMTKAVKDMGFPGNPKEFVHMVYDAEAQVDPEEDREIAWFDLTAVEMIAPPVVDAGLQEFRAEAKTVILMLDRDGDGYISQEESIGALAVLLRDCLRFANSQIAQPVWRAIDVDGDGGISTDEFTGALHKLNVALSDGADQVQANIKPAFEQVDANQDGEIQPDEAESMVKRVMRMAGATEEDVAEVKVSSADFAEDDADGSGGISWDELPTEITDGTTIRQTADQVAATINNDVAPALKDVMSLLDANDDGRLTQEELGVGVLQGLSLA